MPDRTAIAVLQMLGQTIWHYRIVEKLGGKDFLALWKDADPNIPILNEAKAEYSKLP